MVFDVDAGNKCLVFTARKAAFREKGFALIELRDMIAKIPLCASLEEKF